jgi:isoquinoline 1-oxidoreductase subunit beta
VITHTPSGRTVTFGNVAEAAARQAPLKNITLKMPAQLKLLGTPVKRLDTLDKVMGKPIFGIDVRVPQMLHAAIRQSPVFGAPLKGYDEAAIQGRKGVYRVVPLPPDAIAVVGETYWQAQQALNALPVTWDNGRHGNVSSASIREFLSSIGSIVSAETVPLPTVGSLRRPTPPVSGGPQALTHALAKSLRCGPSAPLGG